MKVLITMAPITRSKAHILIPYRVREDEGVNALQLMSKGQRMKECLKSVEIVSDQEPGQQRE